MRAEPRGGEAHATIAVLSTNSFCKGFALTFLWVLFLDVYNSVLCFGGQWWWGVSYCLILGAHDPMFILRVVLFFPTRLSAHSD